MNKQARNAAHMLQILSKKAPKVFESFEEKFGKTGIKHYLDAKGNYKQPESLNIVAKLNPAAPAKDELASSAANHASSYINHLESLKNNVVGFRDWSHTSSKSPQQHFYRRVSPFTTKNDLTDAYRYNQTDDPLSNQAMARIREALPDLNLKKVIAQYEPTGVRLTTGHLAEDPLKPRYNGAHDASLQFYKNKAMPIETALKNPQLSILQRRDLEQQLKQVQKELSKVTEPYAITTYDKALNRSGLKKFTADIFNYDDPEQLKKWNDLMLWLNRKQKKLRNRGENITLADARFYETVFHPGDNPKLSEIYIPAEKGAPFAINAGQIQKQGEGKYAFHAGYNPLGVYGNEAIWGAPLLGNSGKYAFGRLDGWLQHTKNDPLTNQWLQPLSKLSPETWEYIQGLIENRARGKFATPQQMATFLDKLKNKSSLSYLPDKSGKQYGYDTLTDIQKGLKRPFNNRLANKWLYDTDLLRESGLLDVSKATQNPNIYTVNRFFEQDLPANELLSKFKSILKDQGITDKQLQISRALGDLRYKYDPLDTIKPQIELLDKAIVDKSPQGIKRSEKLLHKILKEDAKNDLLQKWYPGRISPQFPENYVPAAGSKRLNKAEKTWKSNTLLDIPSYRLNANNQAYTPQEQKALYYLHSILSMPGSYRTDTKPVIQLAERIYNGEFRNANNVQEILQSAMPYRRQQKLKQQFENLPKPFQRATPYTIYSELPDNIREVAIQARRQSFIKALKRAKRNRLATNIGIGASGTAAGTLLGKYLMQKFQSNE